jgi:hypothetical protein
MARWGVTFSKGSANVQGVGYLNAAGSNMRRFKLTDFTVGCNASPADNTFVHLVQRCTTAPTGTGVTPNALDPADSLAAVTVATGTITADATLTGAAFLYQVSLNQRGTFRWVAVPYFEIICPATANNGLMLGLSAASPTTFAYGAQFEEL